MDTNSMPFSTSSSDNEISTHAKPQPNDFLFGNGTAIRSHPGNMFFHQLIVEGKSQYRGNVRGEKTKLAHRIYAKVKGVDPPGRFLMRDSKRPGLWIEVSEEKAILKICQSLSDERRRPQVRKPDLKNIVTELKNVNAILKKDPNKNDVPELDAKLKVNEFKKSSITDRETKTLPSMDKNLNALSEARTRASDSVSGGFVFNHNNGNPFIPIAVTEPSATSEFPSGVKPNYSRTIPSLPDDLTDTNTSSETHTSGFKSEHNTSPSRHDNLFTRNAVQASDDISYELDSRSDSKLKPEEYISNQSMMIENASPDYISSATEGVTNGVSNLNNDEIPKSVKEPKNDTVLECKNCNDAQNCILSIACIGKSFCTANQFEEESVRIYKNLADLHDKENHSVFHLPSIIVGMCKRISDLEERLKKK